jgi:hypothetical protein
MAQAGVRLVALVVLITCFFNVAISPSATALAAVCAGDEQILLAPEAPHVGSSLMLAAMSGFPHEDVLLLGPNGPIPVARVAIGERFVWQEIVVVERPGAPPFVFCVAGGTTSITACADASVHVAEADASPLFASLNSYGQTRASATGPDQATDGAARPAGEGSPADPDEYAVESSDGGDPADSQRPASRRRPTRTPTPEPDNENENDNTSSATKTPTKTPTSTRVPTATRTPQPTATDTPEPTPTLAPASISSLSPSRPICGQALTIRGERFGTSRSAVDGQVRLDGKEATIDAWNMSQIDVKVPSTVRAGTDRELEVLVAGRRTTKSVPITC